MHRQPSRRRFLQATAALSAGVWVGSRSTHAVPPSEQLAVGIIGIANRGRANLNELLKLKNVRIVAACDVNEDYLADVAAEACPDAKEYTDFRKMLESEKHLDAILTATADHTHAPATLMAIAMGHHVYCEKPLAHNVFEARRVTEAVAKGKRVSQLGTQIHASENYRRVVEIVRSGAIGKVHDAYAVVSKDWGATMERSAAPLAPAPKGLHYDTWLGPAAEWPYSKEWLPANWRRWWNFGNGTLGDMGCHFMDLPFWALDLKYPTKISAEGPPVNADGCPHWLIAHYDFPGGIKLHWYDGGKKPDLYAEHNIDEKHWNSAILFAGDKGVLVANYSNYQLLPEKDFADFHAPAPTIDKSIGHHAEWVDACLKNDPTGTTCHFGYSGPLSETVLLGAVAYRTGKTLEWDAVNLKATNAPEADQFIRREYRKGWEIA